MSEKKYELTTERRRPAQNVFAGYLEELEVGAVYKHWSTKTVIRQTTTSCA